MRGEGPHLRAHVAHAEEATAQDCEKHARKVVLHPRPMWPQYKALIRLPRPSHGTRNPSVYLSFPSPPMSLVPRLLHPSPPFITSSISFPAPLVPAARPPCFSHPSSLFPHPSPLFPHRSCYRSPLLFLPFVSSSPTLFPHPSPLLSLPLAIPPLLLSLPLVIPIPPPCFLHPSQIVSFIPPPCFLHPSPLPPHPPPFASPPLPFSPPFRAPPLPSSFPLSPSAQSGVPLVQRRTTVQSRSEGLYFPYM